MMSKKFISVFNISIFGFFNCLKNANMIVFSIMLNLCNIFSKTFIKTHATNTKFIVFLNNLVFTILFYSYFTKICKAIIKFISVNMIKKFGWKRASFYKPNQSMSRIFFPLKLNISISKICNNSSNSANFNFWSFLFLQKQSA